MWFNFALIVSLLLCATGFSLATQKIESNDVRDGSLTTEIQPHTSNGSRRNKTNFKDLNGDVLYLIFNYSNLTALTSIAEIAPKFAFFAGQAFRQKYQNYGILIYDGDNYRDKANTKSLLIGDFKLALNVLRYFGGHIKNLRVDERMLSKTCSKTINRFVNEYTIKSLTHFYLERAKEYSFSQFTKPFEKIVEFKCSIEYAQVGEILPFNRIFPKLKRFCLDVDEQVVDYSCFNVNMPHLEDLYIRAREMQLARKHKRSIEGLVQKNPQIKAAELDGIPPEFLEYLQNLLPTVFNLTLHHMTAHNSIHFDSVKHFQLLTIFAQTIDKVTFSQLESIEMRYFNSCSEAWMTFFGNHRNLTKLSFKITEKINAQALMQIMTTLPYLIDLTIDDERDINFFNTDTLFTIDMITEIMESHANLTRLKLISRRRELNMERLHESFDNEWNVINCPENLDIFLLEKRIDGEAGI